MFVATKSERADAYGEFVRDDSPTPLETMKYAARRGTAPKASRTVLYIPASLVSAGKKHARIAELDPKRLESIRENPVIGRSRVDVSLIPVLDQCVNIP